VEEDNEDKIEETFDHANQEVKVDVIEETPYEGIFKV
jgi:hypothetical protein